MPITDNKKLVFLHLPKTGGTSLHDLIVDGVGKKNTSPERFNRLHEMDAEKFNEYKFFSGHYDWQNTLNIPGPKEYITFIREPKSRLLSLYYFWRSHRWEVIKRGNLKGPEVAKSHSLLEFLRYNEDGIPGNINNIMVKSLGRTINAQFETFGQRKELLDLARENLGQFRFVGFLEAMDKSITQAMDIVGLPFDGTIPHARNSAQFGSAEDKVHEKVEKEPMTPEIEAEIERHTEWDQKLYQIALIDHWKTVPYHTPIDINIANQAYRSSLTKGWYNLEPRGIWMNETRSAKLDIRVEGPSRGYLIMDFTTFLPNPGMENELTVLLNGEQVETHKVDGPDGRDFKLVLNISEKDFGKVAGHLSFEFKASKAFRPADHVDSDDVRQLSFKLLGLQYV
ncbi:sulfotransferase family 2 domain-containing protein [Ponticaulis sp.]|uniref:sulfotransferase family 2 domain-containing protein n=1 Tax=Ponticaulis sp. TaxID=2020902 RepID=UPI000B69F73D|nr:sulfotransferase family 2 domain-containing protein [Ponticaulis sp.]MAI90832.1 hypothetical protein [Ponticaulis sp.]OUX98807.1 MAG: hypothetical protein CBB65_10350 [Hyphomonadaceae bacterium TMED5]|tara:strand:- start:24466 stop:25653 length:1188 start_codon:yes stop_codon:yes gene_type:complete